MVIGSKTFALCGKFRKFSFNFCLALSFSFALCDRLFAYAIRFVVASIYGARVGELAPISSEGHISQWQEK